MPATKRQALDDHPGHRPGKIVLTSSKPCRTQRDLSPADDALSPDLEQPYPFGQLKDEANVLIFPDLKFGQHRLQAPGEDRRKPEAGTEPDGDEQARTFVIAGTEVEEIVNLAAIAVLDAQETTARVRNEEPFLEPASACD